MILVALTLSAGFSVFYFMLKQTEALLANHLQTSLTHHIRLFDSQIQNRIEETLALQPRISLITNLQIHLDKPGDPTAAYELQRRADLIRATGFSAVAIYDTQNRLMGHAGQFVQQPQESITLHTKLPSQLMWQDSFILRTQVEILNEQNTKLGWVLTETHLPQIMKSLDDIKSMGSTTDLAVCARRDPGMACFPLTPAQAKFQAVWRSAKARALPMYQALQGKTDIQFSKDYRSEPVVAAFAPIGTLGLGMVLKIDQAELYRPAQSQIRLILPLLLGMLLIGFLLLRWIFVPIVRELASSEREKHETNIRLQDLEERWRFALESTGAGVWDFCPQKDEILLSAQCKAMLGFADHEIGTSMTEWTKRIHLEDLPELLAARRNIMAGGNDYFTNEHRKLCKDGSWKWIQVRGMVVARNAEQQPTRVIGTYLDISVHKQAEQRILHLANHDALTGLPNRSLLQDRVQQALLQAQRAGQPAALLFIDLDNFKTINDSLGHDIGDQLLIIAAQRLVSCLRGEDTVARQGGDEFIVLLPSMHAAEDAGLLAEKLLGELQQPFHIQNHELHLSASIGIAIYPNDGQHVDSLLKNSDIAMYHAKERGRNNYQYFTQEMNRLAAERLLLGTDLRHALVRGEFQLHYQPIVEIANGRPIGVEALLRWQHPTRGLLPPTTFIPLAEESGLINDIGFWVIETACSQFKQWQDSGYSISRMAINLSARQFRQPTLAQSIGAILEKHDVPAQCIELEMTESLLVENHEDVLKNLEQFGEMGVGISIDDFGTGYSSLSYLKRFTIHTLKIDRSFVQDIRHDPNDAAIVSAIIALGHSLQMKVVAEGVESAEQLAFLQQQGCDLYQGYLFSKPQPAEQILGMLQQ